MENEEETRTEKDRERVGIRKSIRCARGRPFCCWRTGGVRRGVDAEQRRLRSGPTNPMSARASVSRVR